MDYTAVGQTTHLAARMEQLADAGQRSCSRPRRWSWRKATSQVKPLGPVPVKGLAEPVEVYELIGARRRALAAQAAAARGLTRFVGRDAELEQLRQALEQAGSRPRPGRGDRRRAGGGQVAPRLGVHPLAPRRRAGSSWRAGSVSYGKATTYLPVIDLLKALLQDRGPRRPARRSARR